MTRISASDINVGISEQLAAQRRLEDGYNELPSAKPRNVFSIAWNVVREPMFILLMACGVVYLFLGNHQEAFMLLGFVFIVMGITLVQERKSERAIDALRELSSPRALVVREGQRKRIAGRDLVRGDIVILSEGDRIPADGVLLSSMNMTVDESLLTGESVAVRKIATDVIPEMLGQAGGDDQPFLFSGTLVSGGNGVAQVIQTGSATRMGGIGKALFSVQPEQTHIQREIGRVVKWVAILCFLLAALLAIWHGVTRDDWLNGFLVGLTFAMALLPEELPVILTIFLGLGAWRIAKYQVLTRRIPAVEMLGATTVLCVDKTGTLTQNKMSVSMLFANGILVEFNDGHRHQTEHFPEDFHEVLEFGMLASHRDPFDAMEQAIQDAGRTSLAKTEHIHDGWRLVDEYPLSKELLAMSRVWQSPDHENYVISAKGAPEAIAFLCHASIDQVEAITLQVNAMAARGLRVLGVAKAGFQQKELPEIQHEFAFQFLGLIGLHDPLRPGVKSAIKEAHAAGLRVIMITGDYPATAMNIAEQSGIASSGGAITGAELDAMDDAELQQRIKAVSVFCRVVPEQKLRLVSALKKTGETVAMTGDGVNDAPALKAAHIGIAMGGRGSDVARESADLVLLDDDFSSIVSAVRMGRRIFDNIKKAVVFIIAVHIVILGMVFFPVLAGWPLVLMPVHVLFLQLIIDPTCSIVFEAESEESNIMQRPPRTAQSKIFDPQVVLLGVLQGCIVFGCVWMIYSLALHRGMDVDQARTLTFIAMVAGNLGLIMINRSWSRSLWASLKLPNVAMWWVLAYSCVLLSLIIVVPTLRHLFYFGMPEARDVLMSLVAVVIGLGVITAIRHQLWRDA